MHNLIAHVLKCLMVRTLQICIQILQIGTSKDCFWNEIIQRWLWSSEKASYTSSKTKSFLDKILKADKLSVAPNSLYREMEHWRKFKNSWQPMKSSKYVCLKNGNILTRKNAGFTCCSAPRVKTASQIYFYPLSAVQGGPTNLSAGFSMLFAGSNNYYTSMWNSDFLQC